LWGDNKDRMVDFFGYRLDNGDVTRNPEVEPWFMRNGVILQRGKMCGEGILLLSQEEKYRRECRSLAEYLQTP